MKKIIGFLVIANIYVAAIAQNTTYSPSSMFGIGELSTGEGGRYAGMGGVGIALRSPNFINISNPASLSEIGDDKYLFDVGVMAAYKEYTQSGVRNSSGVGNINNIAIGTKLFSWWYAAVALSPVSTVGYAITIDQQVEGTTETTSSFFEGEGGISKIGMSNAFVLSENLSVGVNLSYINGTVTQSERQGSATIEEESHKRAVYADFGLQYTYPLSREHSITIGAVYGYAQRIAQSNTLTVSSSTTDEGIEEKGSKTRQYLPQFFGAGVAYNSPRWMLTAEYKYIDWSKMQSDRSIITFNDQHRIAVGAAYIPGNIYKNPVQLQAGAGVEQSYVCIRNQAADNFYISIGAGFTVKNNNILTLGIKYNDQLNAGAYKEKSVSAYLNIVFGERAYRSKLR